MMRHSLKLKQAFGMRSPQGMKPLAQTSLAIKSLALVWASVMGAVIPLTVTAESVNPIADGITEASYRETVKTLSSDAFLGRKPGQPGEPITVDYLEKRFKELGLEPGFQGTYRQPVPLVEITALPQTDLTFHLKESFSLPFREKTVFWTRRVEPLIDVKNSPLVFVGFGIHAPEFGWDDYKGLNMHGKTAVILINDPGFYDSQLFQGRRMTYYGRWMYKFEEAARQGATGAIIIHQTAPAAYGWEVVRNSNSGPLLEAQAKNLHKDRVKVEGWMTDDSALKLFQNAGLDFKALEEAAHHPGFKPVALKAAVSVRFKNAIRQANSTNVVGILKGTRHADEALLYMAHWDHFGQTLAINAKPDIYHGAVDNGSGVGGIIEIAKAFKAQKMAPERSVVFIMVTGEEFGLLGSAYYADNPIFPLNKTVAAFNIDAMHPQGLTHDVEVLGMGSSDLEDRLKSEALKQGRILTPDSEPEKGYYYRSDHFNLAKVGVPSLYIKPGIQSRNHTDEWIKDQIEDYLKNRYHKPQDVYEDSWDVSGNLEDFTLLYRVGAELSLNREWPAWYPNVSFKAAREASLAH